MSSTDSPSEAQAKAKWHSQRAWDASHPKATWAHAALRSAVRRGLIIPEGCAVCGDPSAEGHHDDYDKPMQVRWLCRGHHQAEHRRLRQGGGDG
ncbi:hypothetical protein [Mesorhizobium sp. CN2-181]|uniref:hypothetical protein n=1 Tax=Mesorhizobium yinganensis TaxID=3157707 RepID=UPI0032B7FB90